LYKTNWILILSLLFFPINKIGAQFAFEKLQANYARDQLTYEQYLVYSALSIYEPGQLPPDYQLESSDLPIKSGTFIIQEIKANWDQISPNYQKLLAPYLQRPNLSYSMVSPGRRFRIHYDLDGINSVSPVDNNRNNIPDYVENAARYFDHSHAVIVDSLGYNPPAPDSSGSGKEFDIYLVNLYKTYGITYLEETVPGNPNAYSCYIEVENDFYGFKTLALQALMVTSAHEYFHAVQVAYRYREEDVFFMEMCSTWMEDFVYDGVNDYLLYLTNFFNSINYPFYYTNASWFEYASSLWIHIIAKKYSPDVIRKVWEIIPKQTAFAAIQQVLVQYGTTFNRELASFGLWNYFTGSRANIMDYYSEGNLYPEVTFNKEYDIEEETIILEDQMRKLSSIFYHIYDIIHGYNIGLIVTNFAIPDDNYLRTDRDSLQIMIVSISDVQTRDSTFFRRNNLVKLTDNIGVQLNVNEGENWFAQAVVTDVNFNHNIVQFFPPFFITEPENRNFINNIYPNPFIIDQNEPLIITYVVSDEKPGELAIYTSEGRLVTKDDFEASRQSYRIFDWDGRYDNGDFVSSGVYIVLLRVGGSVDMKKLAVVR
jgi:hypothetical protein